MNLTDAKNKRPLEQISSQVMDLNLEFPHKFHASNHFSTRCMMDYHGLKSFNNFQHLIFTVSEALKSTANNGRPPVQNSRKVVVLNLDFSIKKSIKKQISTWLLIPIRTCLGSMLWHQRKASGSKQPQSSRFEPWLFNKKFDKKNKLALDFWSQSALALEACCDIVGGRNKGLGELIKAHVSLRYNS